MVKISKALSASGVIEYHREQYVSNYERYYSESGEAKGIWFGKEAAALGLEPGSAVHEEQFIRLANGQDPHSGLQLIEWHRRDQTEPRWVRDDQAWRAHLEALVTAAIQDGREVLREPAGGPKLAQEGNFHESSWFGPNGDASSICAEGRATVYRVFCACHIRPLPGSGWSPRLL